MKYIMTFILASGSAFSMKDNTEIERSAYRKSKLYEQYIYAMNILEKIERDAAIKEVTDQLPKDITKMIQSFDCVE